MKREKDSLW